MKEFTQCCFVFPGSHSTVTKTKLFKVPRIAEEQLASGENNNNPLSQGLDVKAFLKNKINSITKQENLTQNI